MYINKYDILIGDEMDTIFRKVSKQKDYEKILKYLENIEKIINIKNFINLTKKK